MTKQESLRLADGLDKIYGLKAEAAELRRLHEVNAELVRSCKALMAVDFGSNGWCSEAESAALRIRAAILKATGEQQ